ncbi:MAG TPA: tetratricopeptide repeat protein [Trichormus sp.]
MRLAKNAIYAMAMIQLFGSSSALAAIDNNWHRWLAAGDVDLSQERLLPAEDCFRTALRQLDKAPHNDDELVTCLEKLASTLTLEDKTEEAIRLYQRCLKILEREYGNDSPRVLSTLFALGSIYESAGDHELAMGLYSRALSINEKAYGPFSPSVAATLHRLGRANYNAGKVDEAEHNYKRSLAILVNQPSLGASSELESLLGDYSDLLRKKDTIDSDLVSDFQNEFLKDNPKSITPATKPPSQSAWQRQISARISKDVAAQTNQEQRVMLRGFKEPFSGQTLKPAYGTMSDVLMNQQPSRDDQDRFERMIAIDAKALGPNHPTVADDLMGLAMLYIGEHKYAQAKPLLLRAMAIYQENYGSDNMLVTRARSALATVDSEMGNSKQASLLYGNVFDAQVSSSPNTIETAQTLNELGYLYFREGKLDEACTIYQWALPSTEASAGKNSPLVAACLSDYANVLTGLGRIREANVMQARALKILASVPRGQN